MKKYIFVAITFLFIASTTFAQDWANLNRFKDENAKLSVPRKGENRVVFMGNSITEGWIKQDPKYFSTNYINRGISGQTTPQMLIRFRQDVVALQPKAVIILAGTNDIAGNTGPSTLEMIMDNIKSMSEIAKINNIRVVLCSVLPVYDYPWKKGLEPSPKIVVLNKMIKEYAAKNNIVYCDYYSALVDERGGMKSCYSNDGIHPNSEGYAVMKPIAEQTIKKVLSKKIR